MKSHRILIVEHDDAVRHSLRLLLEVYGYAVDDFGDAAALLAHDTLEGSRYLVMDVDLPDMNGVAALEALRQAGHAVPAILISARGSEALRARARGLGVAAWFEKPVDIDRLLAQIAGGVSGTVPA